MAIQEAVVKLRKNNKDFETTRLLFYSYQNANRIDLDRINLLKGSQSEEIWEEVYQRYLDLHDRQNQLRSVPGLTSALPFNGQLFLFQDYLEDIAKSRERAVNFLYLKGQDLLQTGDPAKARKAHELLLRVNNYRPGYQDVASLLEEARSTGTIRVGLNIFLEFQQNVDSSVIQQIKRMDNLFIGNPWVRVDNPAVYSKDYDFEIEIVYHQLFVGPEKIKETIKIEEARVQNGWLYKYDKNGKLKKDADGKEIRVPRFDKVTCELHEYVQEKKASVAASVVIYENIDGTIIDQKRFSAKNKFINSYALAFGNKTILNKKDQSKLKGGRKRHFPDDNQLALEAVVKIQREIDLFLRDHQNVFY